jgi:hypothetical protein
MLLTRSQESGGHPPDQRLVALAAPLLFWLAAEGEVRLIEEPHLARVHGHAWHNYAGRTGRFLPWIGQDASASSASADSV